MKEKTIAEMVRFLLKGRTPEQVAVLLHCARSTVEAWANQVRKPKWGWAETIKRVYRENGGK